MNKFLIILTSIILLSGCSKKVVEKSMEHYNGIPYVEFCDLPLHENQLVYIKGVYSGVDEYWSIHPQKKCKEDLQVELDYYRNGVDLSGEKFKQAFESAYSSYWNTYLEIEGVGVYESSNPNGYGHLGSNKSRFIVKEFVSVKPVKK